MFLKQLKINKRIEYQVSFTFQSEPQTLCSVQSIFPSLLLIHQSEWRLPTSSVGKSLRHPEDPVQNEIEQFLSNLDCKTTKLLSIQNQNLGISTTRSKDKAFNKFDHYSS